MDKKKIQYVLPLAHDMLDKGHLSDALEVLNSLEPVGTYAERQKLIFYTLMSKIHVILMNYSEAYEMADKGMRCAQNLEKNIEIVDLFICRAFILNYYRKTQESMNLLEESSTILQYVPQISETDLQRRMGLVYLNKGHNYKSLGKLTNAIEMYEASIDLLEKWGSQSSLAHAYVYYANLYRNTREYHKSLIYFSKSQKICETHESPLYNLPKLFYLYGTAAILVDKGEIQLALETAHKGIAFARTYYRSPDAQFGLNLIGSCYCELGDWDQAINYYEKALSIAENSGSKFKIIEIWSNLLESYIFTGKITAAQQIIQKMEHYRDKEKNSKYIDLVYRMSKAQLLKVSTRTRDLGLAQEMFQDITHEDAIYTEITQLAILNLCEMLLDEFEKTHNSDALDEFSSLLQRLKQAAENQHSNRVLAETYILEAKVNLLHFELKRARLLLSQAQQIAELYGLKRLTLKISNEHDKLLHNLDVWDQMKKDNAPISERFEKIDITDQVLTMLKQKPVEIPETSPESPILFLMMGNAGLPLYTKIFSPEWTFNEGMFSSFLSAFNSFSTQIFSEGLDRAQFGKYTILMAGVPPFRSCYVFEGQSFPARQKFSQFNESLHASSQLLKGLKFSDLTGIIIQDDASKGLGKLVRTIFSLQ